jgi:1,2-phenylacetyl-CoA epoxidase catalytic subunit
MSKDPGNVSCPDPAVLEGCGWEEWFPCLWESLGRVAQSPVSEIREFLDEMERCRYELGTALSERRQIALNWLWSAALAYLRLDFQEGDALRAAALQAYQASVAR